ncbi:MAG: DUF5723 family protein [Muribaculaceae bacterium]|nr:DUF5723 family protein [Muribaculaceae bacterium]
MKFSKLIIVAAAAGIATAATAQEAPRTAYFLDGYTFRHELNPAFMGERNYFSIPVLANFNVSLFSNVGVNTFLYKTEPGSPYKLTTFMSPTVDANTFLDKLNENNHINANLNMTLLSTGFKAFKGFNTISIGVHTDMGVNLPKDFFRFMKLGQTSEDTRYNFKDIKANATAYAEIALGHSHQINQKLTVGAKLKFLLGLGNVTAHVTDMDVRMSNEQWHIKAQGKVELAAGAGLKVPTKQEAGADYDIPADADLISWDDISYDNFGLAGFGMGVDLGATYQLLPDLQLSLAVNDLGFMNWNHGHIGETARTEWTFDGFQDVAVKDDQPNYEDNKLSEQVDRLWDDLEDVMDFHRTKGDQTYTKALNATIHLGAEYKMPFYKRLTAGFLFSQYIAGCQSWTEGRFYATVKPTGWFDATVNYGASTYGSSFGWMLNFHPKGFNFFIGSDHQFFNLTPQFVPVGHATASLNVGFNVTFGS